VNSYHFPVKLLNRHQNGSSRPLTLLVFITLFIFFLFSSFQLAAQTPPAASSFKKASLPPNLDELVTRVMKTFEVPGLSLAIVKDGQVVLAKGYGVKKTRRASSG